MNINQLSAAGMTTPAPAVASFAPKAPAPEAVTAPAPVAASNPKPEEQVKEAVQKIQGVVDNLAHNLRISVDQDTGKTVVKVMDIHTDEVIRQIPTEEAISIARTLDKVQGLLLNDKA
jgi:flagellar protein FlaG